MNPMSIMAQAEKLGIPQLQRSIQDGTVPAFIGIPLLQEKVKRAKQMQMGMAAQQPKRPSVAEQINQEADQTGMYDIMRQRAAMMQGQMAGTGGISDMLRKPEPEAMAKGGAVAFKDRRLVPSLTEWYEEKGMPDWYARLANHEEKLFPEGEQEGLYGPDDNAPPSMRAPKSLMSSLTSSIPTITLPSWMASQTPATPAVASVPAKTQQISPVISNAVLANNPQANVSQVKPVSSAGTPVPREQPNVTAPTAATSPTAPTTQSNERPPVSVEDAMKEWQDLAGENKGIASLQGRLDKLDSETAKGKDQAFWMALMNAGLGMAAGPSPYALTNIAHGAQQGLQSYKEDMKDLRKADEKVYDLQAKIEDAKRSEHLAALKYGTDSKKTYDAHLDALALQDRQDKAAWDRAVLSANTQRDVANTYSAKYGAKGELTPAQLFKARNEAAKIVDASLAKDLSYIMLSDEQKAAIREQKILEQMQYTTTGNFNGTPGPVNTGGAPAIIPGFKLVGKQ